MNKTLIALIALTLLAVAAESQARTNINLGFGFYPTPVYRTVYYQPAPVYYQPAPVYYAAPQPTPAPVYYNDGYYTGYSPYGAYEVIPAGIGWVDVYYHQDGYAHRMHMRRSEWEHNRYGFEHYGRRDGDWHNRR